MMLVGRQLNLLLMMLGQAASRSSPSNELVDGEKIRDDIVQGLQFEGLNETSHLVAEMHRLLDRVWVEDTGMDFEMEKKLERGDESRGRFFHAFVIFCLIIFLLERAIKVGRYLWSKYNQWKGNG